MEALTFLLMVFVVPVYSYVLQPSLTLRGIGDLDRETDPWSEWSLERPRETAVSEGEAGYEREGERAPTSRTAEERGTDEGPTDYKRGIVENEETATEIASEEALTPEMDPGREKAEEGERGEVELTVGFAKNGEEGEMVDSNEGENAEDRGKEGNSDGDQTDSVGEESDRVEVEKQGIKREEEESKLVAEISPHDKVGEEIESSMQNNKEDIKGKKEVDEVTGTQLEEREDGDHTVSTTLTPLTGTMPSPVEGETATQATLQDITPPPVPPTSPSPVHGHNVLPTPPINLLLDPTMSPFHVPFSLTDAHLQPLPDSVPATLPTPEPTSQVWGLTISHTQAPNVEEGRLVSLVEDDLIELVNVNDSHKHDLKEKDYVVSELLEVKVGPTAKVSLVGRKEDVKVKHKEAKPKKVETTDKMKGTNLLHSQKETNSTAKLPKPIIKPKTKVMANELKTTAKSKDAELATQDQKSTTPPKSKESNSTAKLAKPTPRSRVPRPTDKPKQVKSTGNETKPAVKQNKANTTEVTNSTANPLVTQPTAEEKPSRSNRNKKSKKRDKTKGKKGRKSNKTKKPAEKKKEGVTKPAYFPYFKDNYCPAECACYGRVVQCSDKGVDKIPYGVPYNARYILLMNNRIDSIQLDLLKQYLSMEFLVLSNNQLTDGTIEGALEGVRALKRLYLDRNLLESVPTDLPASLEELRLDNNHLRVMSEPAWERCPGLLVLSLSNNSLGNGSDSLATGVLSPLANLRTLSLDYNQLESVPLGLPLSIKELYLRGNLIKRFRGGAFNGTSELVVLDLSANALTNKGLLRESLLNTTRLESLNLEGNRLKHVPRHLPPSLKTLNLEGNLISSINKATFNALPNLEHLGLARNNIYRVAPGAFRTLPVLHQLDLCHNALRQVPRQLPRALYSAALTHNRIQSVPRDAFCWGEAPPSLSSLVRVQLEHNLIDLGHLDTHAFRCLRGFQVVHFY